MLLPNIQLFADPGDGNTPPTEPAAPPAPPAAPPAGKIYSEDYVNTLKGESIDNRKKAKALEGHLRDLLGVAEGEELGDTATRIKAYKEQSETSLKTAETSALEKANARLIQAEINTIIQSNG